MTLSPPSPSSPALCAISARGVLRATTAALDALAAHLDLEVLHDWAAHASRGEGRVVLSGIGKSGIIAQKISATLASTGCPSFYLHPSDALHGDLGMVTARDSILALSNSGESDEILKLLPNLLRIGVPIGCITGRPESSLAKASRWRFTYVLPEGEGCPLSLAPMASTSLQLAWGDILAAYRMTLSGFTLDGFAANHPAGSLGSKLLRNRDLMHTEYPRVGPQDDLVTVLRAMTSGRLGMCMVLDAGGMAGIISDGDIRRGLERAQSAGTNPLALKASELMTRNPVSVPADMHAVEAARILEARKITFLVVVSQDVPQGVLHIHDLLDAKVL